MSTTNAEACPRCGSGNKWNGQVVHTPTCLFGPRKTSETPMKRPEVPSDEFVSRSTWEARQAIYVEQLTLYAGNLESRLRAAEANLQIAITHNQEEIEADRAMTRALALSETAERRNDGMVTKPVESRIAARQREIRDEWCLKAVAEIGERRVGNTIEISTTVWNHVVKILATLSAASPS